MKKEELETIIENIIEWAGYQQPEIESDLINRCFSEKAQEYFGIKEETDVEPIDWADFNDEEFLYSIAQDAKLCKDDYESLMDDYHNLRVKEWLECLEDDLDEDTVAEFKRRFCDDEDEEEEEEE